MYFLYILKSVAHNRHYIGTTADVSNRLAEHNSGEVFSTKAYRPLRLIYSESFSDKTLARKREIFLKKTARARTELFQKLANAPIV